MEDLEFFVGIDWGSELHQVCLMDRQGSVLGERAFRHGGAGLAELANWILDATGAQPHAVGMAIEIPHGPVVEMERGFMVHSLNPKQLDRFRFSPAGAKDVMPARSVMPCAPTTMHSGISIRLPRRSSSSASGHGSPTISRAPAHQSGPSAALALLSAASPDRKRSYQDLDPRTLGPRANSRQGTAHSRQDHRRPPEAPSGINAEAVLERLREPAIAVAPGTTEAAVAHVEFAQLTVSNSPRHITKWIV